MPVLASQHSLSVNLHPPFFSPSPSFSLLLPCPALCSDSLIQLCLLGRFMAACTNARCPFAHPPGVVPGWGGKGKGGKGKGGKGAGKGSGGKGKGAGGKGKGKGKGGVTQCRFGAGCTKEGCTFSHPKKQQNNGDAGAADGGVGGGADVSSQVCWYDPDCKTINCPYSHPERARGEAEFLASGPPSSTGRTKSVGGSGKGAGQPVGPPSSSAAAVDGVGSS